MACSEWNVDAFVIYSLEVSFATGDRSCNHVLQMASVDRGCNERRRSVTACGTYSVEDEAAGFVYDVQREQGHCEGGYDGS
jgi:hypothetical protein